MIHDWLVSSEQVAFPVMPVTTDPDRLQAGGPRWAWEPGRQTEIGVLRRGRPTTEMRWFSGPPRWSFHTMNAVTRGSRLGLDLCVARRGPLPDADGGPFSREEVGQYLTRWTCDLDKAAAADDDPAPFTEERLWDDCTVDFPVIDPRFLGAEYRHGYMTARDASKPFHPELVKGVFFNALAHYDHRTGAVETWYAGDNSAVPDRFSYPEARPRPKVTVTCWR